LANTTFIIALVGYLAIATALLFRSPSRGWGFPMFVFIYPLFLAALFFVSARLVMLVWLSLSLVNMAIQFIYMKRQRVPTRAAGVMFGSLFLWPVQFAAAVNSSLTEQSTRKSKETGREKIGPLPATIRGTVSYTHHIGTEVGHDAVFLEEFGDLEFVTDSRKCDQIGITEGKILSLTVEERDAPDDIAAGKVLWIVDGKSEDS
jgi:hypothetical protein